MVDAKQELKELFQFGIYKLDNNLCTPEEIKSWNDAIMPNLEMDASIKDLADYFNVDVSIMRILTVAYPFLAFLKVAPEKWFKNKKQTI